MGPVEGACVVAGLVAVGWLAWLWSRWVGERDRGRLERLRIEQEGRDSIVRISTEAAISLATSITDRIAPEIAEQVRGYSTKPDGTVLQSNPTAQDNMNVLPWFMRTGFDEGGDGADPTDISLPEPPPYDPADRIAMIDEGENPFAHMGINRPDLTGEQFDE